jgi:ATP-dependent DNA helicase RecQ
MPLQMEDGISDAAQDFLHHCLLFDIEVNERGTIYSIGAVLQGRTWQIAPRAPIGRRQLDELDVFAEGAKFLLGHNILSHDIPRLQAVAPSLRIWRKPAIDTLYLSPLAFPANPYHRLVKDYHIVRDSINDPAQDAMLAGKIFLEQWDAFARQLASGSDAPILYRGLFHRDAELQGTAEALQAMGVPLLQGDDLHEAFSWLARKHACITAVERIGEQLADGPPPLAYVIAWLSVADGNSVLPPWVRHRFPEVPVLLHQLRESNCRNSACSYCREQHDPRVFLRQYYGFQGFRPEPATEEGKSLQEEIATAAAGNATLFATLPTGAGKSLCYLLPALMRYQRRNMLTIVISPLQALMKDQVDNFAQKTGTRIAAALYGLLTLPERGELLDALRLGDIGILLVSPEQLRNRSFIAAISGREIGAWVFDEAHCLSKWGHDFRPDYLYSIRFIREFAQKEKTRIPPVQCFTATAKKDVTSEIVDLLQSELGLKVMQFAGGHERTNLQYEVWPVERYEKDQTILELLRARFAGKGSAVIYCATRRHTENLAEFLQSNGFTAEAFHAGLDPSLKKRIQNSFIDGATPIICATNAFGMGIDKEDVRLVIHADIPGSLENYLQEAGRAGRDHNASECILIYNEQDIEGQFRMSSNSRLTQREIAQFLRGVRYAAKGEKAVVLTVGDLLRLDVVDIDREEVPDAGTRVRTALAWLERAGFLERNENQTRVFQGRPVVRSLDEAAAIIAGLNLSARQQQRWLAILAALMERQENKSFSADELASLSAFATTEQDPEDGTETQRVIRTLHDMAEQGLLTKETVLTAFVRYKVKGSAEGHLQQVFGQEKDFLQVLRESAPEVEVDTPLELDLRQVNQQLLDRGHGYSTPQSLKLIVYGLGRDGKGLAGDKGSLTVKARGSNRFTVQLNRDWESLLKTVTIRQQAALVALRILMGKIAPGEQPNASLLVEFTLEEVVDGLRNDLLLLPQLKDPLAAAERALTFMHEQGVIDLQQGLAVFRQAMTISLQPEAKKRRYSQADFSPLKTHYTERNFQIHVMNEYARQALDKLSGAMGFVASYFNDDKEDFIRRFFPGREKSLERATGEQSYQRIVDDLKNAGQEKIVSRVTDRNMLVLAGPGAGKTRVVAHRVAFLLRVKRVNPKAMLVLCFNRSAVMGLRRRLRDLVGDEMKGVTALTFHGLALRLLGRSLATGGGRKDAGDPDFASLIRDAVSLLKGETEVLGFGDAPPHSVLMGRFSHILVDEYQDIDGEQYELISLLAGRTMEEKEQKMTIMAVGDDDQNIYGFRGADVDFIRRFQHDYTAEVHYLAENYRSTAHIIAAANALIAHNPGRMKQGHPIRVNQARSSLPPGGNWQSSDPLGQGRVQHLQVRSREDQALAVLGEIRRLQTLGSVFAPEGCAILAREWRDLGLVRSVLEEADLPLCLNWGRHSAFPPLMKIREHAVLLAYLQEARLGMKTASSLLTLLPEQAAADTVWQANLRRLIMEWREETGDSLQPVSAIEDYFYETLSEQRRAQSMGKGLFLSTVHSVKGLEFDHVFILGENWKTGQDLEEERRLYYVAMSRARETLHLLSITSLANPHTVLLSGDFLVERNVIPLATKTLKPKTYTLLGMEDLYLDFAGMKRENDPVRAALGMIGEGDLLRAERRNEQIELVNGTGFAVARLSKSARAAWQGRLETITEVRVVAMVHRSKDDISDTTYRDRCFGAAWEVPVVEVVCSGG